MKNLLFVLMLFNLVLVSCTKESAHVIGALIPEPEIENNEFFDANCTPGDIVLDSFYLDETTRAMLPYDNKSKLVFTRESGGAVILHKQPEPSEYRRKVVEKYCVNADNEWSVGSEVSEHLRITYEGILPSGDEISIVGFMHKEKTWFTDKTKEMGYYDTFQVRVSIKKPSEALYSESSIRCTTWFDDSVVSIEDTDLLYVDEKLTTVTLNGQEFDNVLVGNDDPQHSEVKTYAQKNVGVIAFTTKNGDLFMIQ